MIKSSRRDVKLTNKKLKGNFAVGHYIKLVSAVGHHKYQILQCPPAETNFMHFLTAKFPKIKMHVARFQRL
jgi:hypothetical protein